MRGLKSLYNQGSLGASPSYNGPHSGTPRFCYRKSLGTLRSVRGCAARPHLGYLLLVTGEVGFLRRLEAGGSEFSFG